MTRKARDRERYWCQKCKRLKPEWPSENLRDPLVAALNERVKDLMTENRRLRRELKERDSDR